MASSYGRNFGFRRSDEALASGTEGRVRVPETGAFRQGDLVTLDHENPGLVKKAAANAPVEPGVTGLLVQEYWFGDERYKDDPAVVKNGRQCAIWTGAGIKIWLKNDETVTVLGGGIKAGDLVAWDGSKYVKTTNADHVVGRCTQASDNYAEIVLAR